MGIANINQRREQDRANRSDGGVQGVKHLWLKDKDQAFVAILASGDEGDALLGDVYTHGIEKVTATGKRYFVDNVCKFRHGQETCEFCDNGNRPKHKFGFWAYVYYIDHPKNNADSSWEAKSTAGGTTVFRETIEDVRMFSQGFGQKDYLWNLLVDIYQDQGALNKNVVRIKRTGSGQQDTMYQISSVNAEAKLPAHVVQKKTELPSVLDFFKNQTAPKDDNSKPVDLKSSGAPVNDDDIFGGIASSEDDEESKEKGLF